MAQDHELNRESALALLHPRQPNPYGTEEEEHSWSEYPFLRSQQPFLRVWDLKSGSQPINGGGMKAREDRQPLDTRDSRKDSLTIHVNHKKWTHTPYISFTTSPDAVAQLAEMRTFRRGPQFLTVIDPNTRIANGLPILDARAEMNHYGVRDPYGKSGQYYFDHYLCLWEVTKPEIIGTWKWNSLVANENWYEEIVMPAFRRRLIATTRDEEETGALVAAMNQISYDPSSGDSDTFSEGTSNCQSDDEAEYDNDRKAEGANVTGDC